MSEVPWRIRRKGASCSPLVLAWASTIFAFVVVALILPSTVLRADQPYAPIRQYNLQNARIELHFDIPQKKVMGQVVHTLTTLQEGLQQLDFDSTGLEILSVSVNGGDARFTSDNSGLHVMLKRPGKLGTKYQVAIRYEGTPQKGLYFILPDASYPRQPPHIWTQGEAEDTRYYVPIYDYPNNRETVDMIVTVPQEWTTVANGKLVGVKDAPNGEKTWTWRQSQPIPSYLISLVAGEFDSARQTWRNIPVDYYVPRGQKDRIDPTFARTRDMLTFFSDRLGIPYPWDKYAQTSVDQFVVGGMENVSATTLTTRGLQDPALARESLEGSDNLISHEMAHQWFGDLVTTKDWANLWLNEGFATFMAQLWEEHQYGPDNAAYARWRAQAAWFRQARLFAVPIVNGDFHDSLEYAGNIYGKAGLVLEMLRERMGDGPFFDGLHHYLEVNRLGNVLTPDLIKALEETSHTKLDGFFDQWIMGAGAPRFAVTSSYDAAAKQLHLEVKQTQNIRGRVGLFEVPVDISITTSGGSHTFPVTISKTQEEFSFPAESTPLMVLFDKGSKILKTVDFPKPPAEWIYQLQNARDVPDRLSAAQALGAVKGNSEVTAALSSAALRDPFWGVRSESVAALGRIAGPEAEEGIVAALANSEPWVREAAVNQLARFKDTAVLGPRLNDLFRTDVAYRVRSAALVALGQMRPPGSRETLEAAANMDSPDDTIRRSALRAMGLLGDDKDVPTLLAWSAQGKTVRARGTAIGSLGRLDKKNSEIESRLIAYLHDPNFDVRIAALFALGERGDPAAIAPLEEQLRAGSPTLGDAAMVQRQIDRLRHPEPERAPGE